MNKSVRALLDSDHDATRKRIQANAARWCRRKSQREQEQKQRTPFALPPKHLPPPTNIFDAIARGTEHFDHAPPGDPTDAMPGSAAKIAVLVGRLERGEPLWHPGDRCNYIGAMMKKIPGGYQPIGLRDSATDDDEVNPIMAAILAAGED